MQCNSALQMHAVPWRNSHDLRKMKNQIRIERSTINFRVEKICGVLSSKWIFIRFQKSHGTKRAIPKTSATTKIVCRTVEIWNSSSFISSEMESESWWFWEILFSKFWFNLEWFFEVMVLETVPKSCWFTRFRNPLFSTTKSRNTKVSKNVMSFFILLPCKVNYSFEYKNWD